MRQISLILAAAVIATIPAPAESQVSDVSAKADQYLTIRSEMGNFSGAVLIAKDNKVLFRKGYGYADVEKRIPFTPETQHEVASVSKMFTAMAALKLRDAGKLQLDDSICKYLDDCPTIWQPITVDELIHHTSGIPDYEEALELGSKAYMDFMMSADAMKRIVAEARTKPLDFPPGTKFHYSNTGYDLLSYVVQRAAGRPFADYVTSTLLKPAGMTHSGVISVNLPVSLAAGYTWGDLGWDRIVGGEPLEKHAERVGDLPLTQPDGDAWLFTTVDDLYKWSRLMDGSKLVPSRDVAAVFKPEIDGYGFGWFIDQALNRTRYSHTGALPGRLTYFAKFPNDSITIIILSNVDRGRMVSVSRDLSQIALGDPYDLPVRGKVVELTPEQIAPLVGEYRMADGKVLTVSVDKMLMAKLAGRYTAGLIPLSPTEFYFPLGDGRAIFTLGPDGKATAVNMRYGGVDHIAKR
jgi:CubicO group peptidase (beta-lactamase class C family)